MMNTEQNRPPRVAAIHDMSGFGRCSLAVILPILSAMGVQVCPVPTAILSTHTGGMGEVVLRDLTEYIRPALEHYKRLELDFECVYTGFLASEAQIGLCREFMAAYPGALKVVDPVMGDHGKPYRTYTLGMQRRMHELVEAADVITPNLT
jgi:pyridoxine kinase